MNIDDSIKSALKEHTEHIRPDINSFEKIKSKIELNRSGLYMKRFNIRKTVIAASCGILVMGAAFLSPNIRTVVADTWIKYVHGYTDIKSYDKPQTNDTLKKDTGFSVKVPETLTGGYKLLNTSINGLVDGSSGKLENKNQKELGAMYTKDGVQKRGHYISLSEFTHELPSLKYKNIQKVQIGDKTGYYREFTIITYNDDSSAKPTKQEWADQKDGKVTIVSVSAAKGSKSKADIPDRSTSAAHELSWNDNGVNYVLSEEGYNLKPNDLINMAQDIIK